MSKKKIQTQIEFAAIIPSLLQNEHIPSLAGHCPVSVFDLAHDPRFTYILTDMSASMRNITVSPVDIANSIVNVLRNSRLSKDEGQFITQILFNHRMQLVCDAKTLTPSDDDGILIEPDVYRPWGGRAVRDAVFAVLYMINDLSQKLESQGLMPQYDIIVLSGSKPDKSSIVTHDELCDAFSSLSGNINTQYIDVVSMARLEKALNLFQHDICFSNALIFKDRLEKHQAASLFHLHGTILQ